MHHWGRAPSVYAARTFNPTLQHTLGSAVCWQHEPLSAPEQLSATLPPSPPHPPPDPTPQGTTSVWYTLDPAGRTGVLPSDPAYAQVQRLAAGAQALGSQLPCPDNPRLAPVFPPVLDCPVG